MTSPGRPRSAIPVRGAFAGGESPTPGVDALLTASGGMPPEQVDEPAVEAEPRPARRATPAPRRAAATTRRPRSAPARPSSALIPAAPEDRYVDRQQLNVRITKELHWALRASSFMTNDSMSRVVTRFLEAYAEEPEVWLDLFAMSQETGIPIAEVLNPAVRAALTGMLEES